MNFEYPADLGFSPDTFPNWRQHQRKAIMDIAGQLSNSHDIVSMAGPTGSGKSLLACAIAKVLGLKALVLVGTKQLAEQYEESFENIVVIKGRGNYPCPRFPDLTADLAPCTMTEDKCPLKFDGGCPYYAAKARAQHANLVVTNYSYGLAEMNYIGKMARPLIVLDESHRTERELMSFINISINKKVLESAGISLPRLRGFSKWKEWAEAILPRVDTALAKMATQATMFNWDKVSMKTWQKLDRTYKELSRLTQLKETWLEEYHPWSVQFKPVWVKQYAEKAIFSHAEKFLLMSATPPMMETLGIKDYGELEVPSTFPVKNRPFINRAAVKLNYRTMDSQLPIVVKECDKIIARHARLGHKGIVHSTSYRIRDYILAYSEHSNIMMTHDQKDRSEVLTEFFDSEGPRVLLSPSMSEGVSFDDDKARYQIIVKTPFLSLGDPQVKARSAENRNWYIYEAVTALTQTYGRITRSPTDWGETIYLDGHLNWLRAKYKGYFRKWFLESIISGRGR